MWILLSVYTLLIVHPFSEGLQSCFQVLAIKNAASILHFFVCMYLCEHIINLFVKTPRFIIAEPYNQTMFIF